MAAAKWSVEVAFGALLEAADEGIMAFDESSKCRAFGRRAAELFGIDPSEAVGLQRSELVKRIASSCDAPGPVLALAAPGDQAEIAGTVELRGPRGGTIAWTSVALVRSGARIGRLDIVRDVTRERRAEETAREVERRIEEASAVDALTGLANRRRFEQESDREHRRAQRAWDSYAVARIDIDCMSKVNEAHGRGVGDDILRRLAEELRSARHECNIVGRWDGDEFIVLLPGADGAAARTVVKRAVASMLERAVEITGAKDVTLCAGAAVWIPPSGELAEDIIRRAGAALDAARARGAGTVEIDAGAGQWKDEMSEG